MTANVSPYLAQPVRNLEDVMATKSKAEFVTLKADASQARVSAVLMQIADHAARIEGIDAQIKKLQARKKSAQDAIEERRNAISGWMTVNDHSSLKLPEATLTMKLGQPKVLVTDEDALPVECFTEQIVRKLNKELVKAKLLTGESLEGATMSNAAPVLQIRF